MSNDQQIQNIMNDARPERDPAKLRQYAMRLRELGAWHLADVLERDAQAIERKYAEAVNS